MDAFASKPFSGNPAAVCLLPKQVLPLTDEIRQAIAAENNLSETAFLEECPDCQRATGEGESHDGFDGNQEKYILRWFTPVKEVPLCGHATMAAAAVVFSLPGRSRTPAAGKQLPLQFITQSGPLFVYNYSNDASTSNSKEKRQLAMELPLLPGTPNLPLGLEADSPVVQAALGGLRMGRSMNARFQVQVFYQPFLKYLMIVLLHDGQERTLSQEEFERYRPDIAGLKAVNVGDLVGVIVTTPAPLGSQYDFLSRFFAPWAGIDEDPVTGSAHSVLGPYWASRLGTAELSARQCSPRGGDLYLTVKSDDNKVVVRGDAVIVIAGELHMPE